MNGNELRKKLVEIAAQSPCKKRKVGAAIVEIMAEDNFVILSEGFNFNPTGAACELNGVTVSEVIHAEVSAINNFRQFMLDENWQNTNLKDLDRKFKLFVTHEPCDNCRSNITINDLEYEVVGDFLKFDQDKIRYDLVPPSFIKAIARVYTYGARKYKENNWQKTPTAEKSYMGAAMRHIEAWRAGEINDPDTGMNHLAHAATNLSFLIHLETKPQNFKRSKKGNK
jgi:deoxycytidylate deaminase